MGTTITINGRTHVITGNANAVAISNGTIIINGKVIESDLCGIVEIRWDGPLASLTSDAAVTCGDVQGDVRAGGSVTANSIGGSVNAGGSVNCGAVNGSVNAGGSVSCRR